MKKGIVLLYLAAAFWSCTDYTGETTLKSYLGDFGDVLVVCEKDFWSGEFSDTLKMYLTEYLPAAMPAQGQLDIEYCTPEQFVGSAQRFRNIININIGDRVENLEPNVKVIKDEFAKEQLCIYFRAKDQELMKQLIKTRYQAALNKINDEEVLRKQRALYYRSDTQAKNYLKEKKNYEILVPEKYTVQLDTGNVLWMTKYTSTNKKEYEEQKLRDIIIQTYEYSDQKQLELNQLIAKRDTLLKQLTYNPETGNYRAFQTKHEPTVRILESGKNYKLEIRSMWTTIGKFEGGPSYQYVLLDYDNRRIIHADAQIYAPGTMKREILRELEAIVKSIKP